MSNHTETPWAFVSGHHGYIITAKDGAYDVAVVRNIGNEDNLANAERIVACVNACRDMDDPRATISILYGAQEVLAAVVKQRDELELGRDEMQAQRDELLAALRPFANLAAHRDLVSAMSKPLRAREVEAFISAMHAARVIIAKVKP